jgi:anaerobic selenocysteine-containing dehydrogenase
VPASLAEHYVNTTESFAEKTKRTEKGPPPRDPTLQHPHCVYQILRRHYATYTPDMVERTTGCPRDVFVKIAEALAGNSGRERTGTICYAVGWTHHTTGVRMIRAAAIIQGLLGNVGRPGGGILALRGHSSIQGSTDIPTLYNMLPTYLPQPNAFKPHTAFRMVAQLPKIRRQPVEGVFWRCRPTGQRFRLCLAAANCRRPFAIADDIGYARRRHPRHVHARPEPGGRRP